MDNVPSTDWRELRLHRMGVVQTLMRDHDVQALLVTGPDNIRYATDFRAWFIVEAFDWYAALVTRDGESYIFVPFADEDINDPDPELPWIKQFVATPSWVSNASQPSTWVRLIKKKLEHHKIKRAGIEGLSPSVAMLLMQEMPDVIFTPMDRELGVARQIKHVEEIKLLESNAKRLSRGSDAVLEFIGPGLTDHELLAIATAKLLGAGAGAHHSSFVSA